MEERAELRTELFAVEREWTVEGIPVLTAKVELPRAAERRTQPGRRIDRFYQMQGRACLRYAQGWLFPHAAEELRAAQENSTPFSCARLEMSYCVTCNERGLWSVCTRLRETAGQQELSALRGDVWDLRTGWPVPLSAFFPRRFPIRRTLLAAADEELERRTRAGLPPCREDWRQALRRSFNRENFYAAPDGLRFFWQAGAVTAPAQGAFVLALPFSEEGCRRPLPGPEEGR